MKTPSTTLYLLIGHVSRIQLEQEFGNSNKVSNICAYVFDPVCFFASCCSQPLKKAVNSWWSTYKCTMLHSHTPAIKSDSKVVVYFAL